MSMHMRILTWALSKKPNLWVLMVLMYLGVCVIVMSVTEGGFTQVNWLLLPVASVLTFGLFAILLMGIIVGTFSLAIFYRFILHRTKNPGRAMWISMLLYSTIVIYISWYFFQGSLLWTYVSFAYICTGAFIFRFEWNQELIRRHKCGIA